MKILMVLILLSSCVMDTVEPLATIKNKSKRNIVVVTSGDDAPPQDPTLFYSSLQIIKHDSTSVVFKDFVTNPQINKAFFYFFDDDSAYKYFKLNKVLGIVSKSFLKKYSVDMDSLKKHNTIIFSDSLITCR